jgi:predicted GNAT family N-acyltransferase
MRLKLAFGCRISLVRKGFDVQETIDCARRDHRFRRVRIVRTFNLDICASTAASNFKAERRAGYSISTSANAAAVTAPIKPTPNATEETGLHPHAATNWTTPLGIPGNGDDGQPQTLIAPMMSSIAIAETERELLQIGRLRYELFVERDGKSYCDADNDRRLFLEPVDQCSLNFFGAIGNDCVVAVRSTRVQDAGGDQQLCRLVEQSGLPADQVSTTVICSRLVVCDRIRARVLIPELFRHVYRAALASGMTNSILAARPSLISIFERFGFLAASSAYLDEIAGPMVIMKLDLLDRDHMARTGSPLLPDYDEFVSHRSTHRNPS